jgi:ribonuclease D
MSAAVPVNAIPATISREELALLPVRKYEGAVVVVATEEELARATRDIRHERVIGFDTETPPTFRKGQSHQPTLAQIATANAAYLFQLHRLDFSRALTEMLENASLVKTGVGLGYDLKKLAEVFPFTPRNVVDLGDVAQRCGWKQTGVRNLAGMFLGFRITKGPRTSNWRRLDLSPNQIHYAATDAWVCRELYLRFEKLGFLEKL